MKIMPRALFELDSDNDEISYGRIDVTIKPCKYKYRGCKEKRAEDKLIIHENECRFRWFKCEGRRFAAWDCPWKGYREDIMNHYKKIHPQRTYMKIQNYIDLNILFDEDSYDIELIQNRKQLFWYKHRFLRDPKIAYWLCQYIGPQQEAVSYCYELIITDGARKVAVTQLCFTDGLDADEIYESGNCVIMTHDQIRSFMGLHSSLKIYFKIKRNVKRKKLK